MDVYFMRRRGGPVVLSSLADEDFTSISRSETFRIVVSSPLDEMELQTARSVLGQEVHRSLISSLQDRRYIPRLIFSSAVFIVLYLFLSVAVPDPIPVIDEIVFSLLGSLALWIILSRSDEKSSLMRKMMEVLELSIENAEMVVSSEMQTVEEYYEALYSFTPLATAHMIATRTLPQLEGLLPSFAENLSASLLLCLEHADRGFRRTLKRIENDDDTEKTERFLIHQMTLGSLDLLDLALYISLKN